MSSESAALEPATIVDARPAEVPLGAAPQILDLMEAGFTYTEASSLPDAERDLYAQLVRERTLLRERERELARPRVALL